MSMYQGGSRGGGGNHPNNNNHPRGGGRMEVVCHRCGQPGHYQRDCNLVRMPHATAMVNTAPTPMQPTMQMFTPMTTAVYQPMAATQPAMGYPATTVPVLPTPAHHGGALPMQGQIPGAGRCFKCGGFGHKANECPSGADDAARPCFNCGEYGHLARDCVKPKVCLNCGKPGHIKKNCPHPPRRNNNSNNYVGGNAIQGPTPFPMSGSQTSPTTTHAAGP